MIVITGATGQLGRQVIKDLLKKVPANQIIATVRNEDKAQDITALGVTVRYADYNEPKSWYGALEGAKKVLLISSNEIGQRVQQHQTVIDAASRAGVKQLIYTSILHADTSTLRLASEHRATESAIHDSGLAYTILRNGWYVENYTMGIPAAVAQGAVYGCAGNGRISSASRKDYAEAAVEVLTNEHHTNKVYELAGDNAFTMTDFAATLSRLHGKTIEYINLPEEAYKNALIGVGLPEPFASLLADSDTGIANGQLFEDGKQLSQLIGRPIKTLESVISNA
jgi:NAD(P)H dehydrogenase (quinone)